MTLLHAAIALSLVLPGQESEEPVEPKEHDPLAPVLKMARDGYARIEQDVKDYQCNLTKREFVRGRLRGYETMLIKIRHRQVEDGRLVVPFSVYVKFSRPERVAGREVLYVEGRNGGKMIVRNGGDRLGFITTSVAPDASIVMRESRYPITEIGVKNLVRRLIEVGERLQATDGCKVQILEGAKINDRPCTMIQVSHPEQREDQTFKTARIFVDDQLHLPVHYTAYGWPEDEDAPPEMLEQYTYTDIRMNVGFTDWDFDHRNDQYHFLKSFQPAE